MCVFVFFVNQKTAYEMRISDLSSDVCSSDLQLSPSGYCSLSSSKICCSTFSLSLAVSRSASSWLDTVLLLDCFPSHGRSFKYFGIGRASCRERVCQYV